MRLQEISLSVLFVLCLGFADPAISQEADIEGEISGWIGGQAFYTLSLAPRYHGWSYSEQSIHNFAVLDKLRSKGWIAANKEENWDCKPMKLIEPLCEVFPVRTSFSVTSRGEPHIGRFGENENEVGNLVVLIVLGTIVEISVDSLTRENRRGCDYLALVSYKLDDLTEAANFLLDGNGFSQAVCFVQYRGKAYLGAYWPQR